MSARWLFAPGRLLAALPTGKLDRADLAASVALFSLGSALFGAAVGAYQGGAQIGLAALKMPVFLLATLGISFLAMHVLASLIAPGLTVGRTLGLSLFSVATTAAGLLALSPAVALFSLSAPRGVHRTYLSLWLLLVGSVAAAGAVSVRQLIGGLQGLALAPGHRRRIVLAWLVVYGFVGSQMGWLLRPWVGSSQHIAGYFSWERNLEGNFYEALYRVLATLVRGA